MREHLHAIGKLFIDQNLNPSEPIIGILLQSKLRQYKSLKVMKSELESVQAELVKYGCDPVSGKCMEKE